MSWLSDYVKQHSEFEAPIEFYTWAGLAAISAVIKDNVWIDCYLYNMYGNIYVMLHAESGMKKGPPVNSARKLVTEAIGSDCIITGRSSIQGILKEMGSAQSEPGGNIKRRSATFICSSELTSSLVEDPVATMILTDLYDRNYNDAAAWKSLLKMEQFSIPNPTITMLTATNEAMSEDFFTGAAIRGGYFARTFVIHETKRNRPNSLQVPPLNKIDYKGAAEYLKRLTKLRGPFKPTGSRVHTEECNLKRFDKHANETFYFSKAGYLYEEWYAEFLEIIDNQDTKDETGATNRFGDSVRKVAMLMSLAESDVLEIKEETMYNAIKTCERLIGNVKKVTIGRSGSSSTAMIKGKIIYTLLTRQDHKISKQMLMKNLMYDYSSPDEFNEIINSLYEAGSIQINPMGQSVVYSMSDEQVKAHMNLLAGKRKGGKL